MMSIFHNFIVCQLKAEQEQEQEETSVFFTSFWCFGEDGALHKNNLNAPVVFTCKQNFQNDPC